MKGIMYLALLLLSESILGQDVASKIERAIHQLELDSQLKHGIISIFIVDSKTGSVIYNKNGEIGLAPASCQKIVTSVSAFELLGSNYRFKTSMGYLGNIIEGSLHGNIWILGTGDPTLGSWRYSSTKEDVLLLSFEKALKKLAPNGLEGTINTSESGSQTIPDGWIWQDIGNYYGAGASIINWRENQFDIILRSGNSIGDPVDIVGINPPNLHPLKFTNELISATEGSGDNGYIYLPPKTSEGYLKGTIPVRQKHFTISGALPDPANLLKTSLELRMGSWFLPVPKSIADTPLHIFYEYFSPPFDSINYWFLKKSINLYGEALLKAIAFEKTSHFETDSGVSVIRRFWKLHGIDNSSLKIIDGSGLSPGNRVTTHSLVSILQYAKDKRWFSSFYYDLPEINGIKMKDGYINGVRSYTGFIKSHHGSEFTFSFIVNNFDGSPALLKEKMWKVLEMMK